MGGIMVLFDSDRVLLSKLLSAGPFSTLTHPLLYYVSIGLAILGLILASAGVLGCWASCMNNYCLLTSVSVLVIFSRFRFVIKLNYFLVLLHCDSGTSSGMRGLCDGMGLAKLPGSGTGS